MKMKKTTRQLLILSCVLVFFIAAFGGLKLYNLATDRANKDAKTSDTIYLNDIGNITNIAYRVGGETLSFHCELDSDLPLTLSTWFYDDDDDFPLMQDSVRHVVYAVYKMKAVRKLDMPEDLSAYGLEEDERWYVWCKDENGVEFEVYLGGLSGDGKNYYAMLPNDDEHIYTISDALFTALDKADLYEIITMEEVKSTSQSILEKISMEYDGTIVTLDKEKIETKKDLKTFVENVWYVTIDGNRVAIDSAKTYDIQNTPANESESSSYAAVYLANLIEGLADMELDSCAMYDPSEAQIAKYGLDDPLTVTVHYIDDDNEKAQYTLNIGNEVNLIDGSKDSFTHFYTSLKDSSYVNYVNADFIVSYFYLFEVLTGISVM